ncbi:SgcJ/EcaC family oxidoreductase [Streptoalloteichus hindustanus]|uniref:DUF4440 domain-containing protein n=1 Tax=Streptoalloteichus hindustanus TaxID=2017 RepID=A0A1M5CWM8_STRHI|nr:conserved hypothetical protein [Streptoalloteichus hindustanus]
MLTVDEVVAELQRVWNAGDGAGWAAHFAEDAEFVDVVGRVQHGRQVIAGEHQKILDTLYRGSRIAIRRVASRPLCADVLLVRTTSVLRVPAGPRAGETRAIQTMIFQNGQILAFHNTIRSGIADFAQRDEDLGRLSPLGWDAD